MQKVVDAVQAEIKKGSDRGRSDGGLWPPAFATGLLRNARLDAIGMSNGAGDCIDSTD